MVEPSLAILAPSDWIAIVSIAGTVLIAVGSAWINMRVKTDVLSRELELLVKSHKAQSDRLESLQDLVQRLVVRLERLTTIEELRAEIQQRGERPGSNGA